MTVDVQVAENRAKELMTEFGLIADGWRFRWSSAEAEFGACWHSKKELVLSKPLTALNDEAHVENTIRHEIAHALAGARAGHDWRWAQQCRVVGIEPRRCYDSRQVVQPEPRWLGVCALGTCAASMERRELGQAKFRWQCKCDGGTLLRWIDRRQK